jgi:hypothetical protein
MLFKGSFYLQAPSAIIVLATIATGHVIPDSPAAATVLESPLELQFSYTLATPTRDRAHVTEAPSAAVFQEQLAKREIGVTCTEWSILNGPDGKQ